MSQSEFFEQLKTGVIVVVSRDLSGIRRMVERGDMVTSEEIGEVGGKKHWLESSIQ
jgi:hypothetical protein